MKLSNWQHQFIATHGLASDYVVALNPLLPKLTPQTVPFCLGISGSQGSGKSTLAAYVAAYFEYELKLNTSVISLDDYYLSKQARAEKAAQEHPLFATRGVPGTHDLAALVDDIQSLLAGHETAIRRFNKALDEPFEQPETVGKGMQCVIIEGWCLAVPAQQTSALVMPINAFEKTHDKDTSFRQRVNQYLAQYKMLTALINKLVFINSQDFSRVLKWRTKQEHQLIARTGKGMTDAEIAEFICYFERITRHSFACMPALSDITLNLSDTHAIEGIVEKI
jgi:D-glycerate 3-kinase